MKKMVEEIYCDWCKQLYDDDKRDTYIDSGFKVEYQDVFPEFKLEYTVGQSDGYDWVETSGFKVEDLCPLCAKNLKILMVDAGITVTDIHRD